MITGILKKQMRPHISRVVSAYWEGDYDNVKMVIVPSGRMQIEISYEGDVVASGKQNNSDTKRAFEGICNVVNEDDLDFVCFEFNKEEDKLEITYGLEIDGVPKRKKLL